MEEESEDIARRMASIRVAIEEVENAHDDFITSPQRDSHRMELTNAMYSILLEEQPLHRRTILERVKERRIYVGGVQGGMNTLATYLSTDERFKNVGRGVWALADDLSLVRRLVSFEAINAEDMPF